MIPVGRFGAPAKWPRWPSCWPKNGYITGQTINVNGGWYMS